MKVKSASVTNYKRLRLVEVTPESELIVVGGRNGQGKQQPVSEPVLTPDGWRPIGHLAIGDLIIGSCGRPIAVTGVFPQTERRTFLVTLAGGRMRNSAPGGSTRCGPEHLWTVSTWSDRGRRDINWITETLTTEELVRRGIWRSNASRRWALPLLSPVEFRDSGMNLPVDAYTFGAILGDGHIERSGYTSVYSADSEIIDRLQMGSHWLGTKGKVITVASAEWSRPLSHLGLAGKLAHEKFIPPVYLRASVADRRELLAGLMDTDGTPAAEWAEYATSSLRLANDVTELALSLGYVAYVGAGQTKRYRYLGEQKTSKLRHYIVRIKGSPCPFWLSRKTAKWHPSDLGRAFRFIDRVEQVEDEDSVCIQVAAADGLYVTKDYILTHNTSLLDALAGALGGTKSRDALPVHEGADGATIVIQTVDPALTITQRYTAGGSYSLKITNPEGMTAGEPASYLKKFYTSLTFDPLEFTRMGPHEQGEALLKLVGLDFRAADKRAHDLFESRTVVNREVTGYRQRVANLPAYDESLGTEPVSMSDLVDAHREAVTSNARRDAAEREVQRVLSQRRAAQEKLEQAKQLVATAIRQEAEAQAQLTAAPEPIDTAKIEADIANVEERNKLIRANFDRHQADVFLTEREGEAAALSADLDQLKADKRLAIAAADMPIPGLGINDDGIVTYCAHEPDTAEHQHIPFSQAAASEQLRASAAIALSMMSQLRVLLIRDGSLLDDDSMELIRQLAEDAGAQVWCEKVGTEGASIVIENGVNFPIV